MIFHPYPYEDFLEALDDGQVNYEDLIEWLEDRKHDDVVHNIINEGIKSILESKNPAFRGEQKIIQQANESLSEDEGP